MAPFSSGCYEDRLIFVKYLFAYHLVRLHKGLLNNSPVEVFKEYTVTIDGGAL